MAGSGGICERPRKQTEQTACRQKGCSCIRATGTKTWNNGTVAWWFCYFLHYWQTRIQEQTNKSVWDTEPGTDTNTETGTDKTAGFCKGNYKRVHILSDSLQQSADGNGWKRQTDIRIQGNHAAGFCCGHWQRRTSTGSGRKTDKRKEKAHRKPAGYTAGHWNMQKEPNCTIFHLWNIQQQRAQRRSGRTIHKV